MLRQHPSTDVKARSNSLQDLLRIMTCIWNDNLHGQSQQKQQMQSLGVPAYGSLDNTYKMQGTW